MSITVSLSPSVGSFPFKTKWLTLSNGNPKVVLGSTESSASGKEPSRAPSVLNGWIAAVAAADPSEAAISPLPLSATHAVLSYKGGKVYISDADSAFGTFVNGTRISSETELKNGDTISLGSPIARNSQTPLYITDLHLIPVIAKVSLA